MNDDVVVGLRWSVVWESLVQLEWHCVKVKEEEA